MNRRPLLVIVFGILIFTLATTTAFAAPNGTGYKRNDIANARFGTEAREELLKKAHGIAAAVNKRIVGQEIAAKFVQDRAVQYLESFPNRTGEPVALNLIGLPGVGKTAMLDELRKLGFPIVQMDVQAFAGEAGRSFISTLQYKVDDYVRNKKPLILVLEELDKLPEKSTGEMKAEEKTSPVIGTLNQILSDGRMTGSGLEPVPFSNVLVLTTMNFSPAEIELFAAEVLGKPKSFYDFTVEDFQAFDKWIRSQPSARYKVLSKLFRSNTVSRLAPNTVLMQPLTHEGYKTITEIMAKNAVERTTQGANVGKRVSVTVEPSMIDFLAKETVLAPSGARETVFRTGALTEQLVNYGIKYKSQGDDSLNRPRKLSISMDVEKKLAKVKVVEQILRRGKLEDGKTFEFTVGFDEGARLFIPPTELATDKPVIAKKTTDGDGEPKPPTKKEIRAARFPKTQSLTKGLEEAINAELIGQESTTALLKEDLDKYLGRNGPAQKEPSGRIFSGFPGIGKSAIVNLAAAHLDIPVVRVNMQQFASNTPETVKLFMDTVIAQINEVKAKGAKHYILLLEELDKIYEIDPKGNVVDRPVMAVIKDLLNDGQAAIHQSEHGSVYKRVLDVADAYIAVTMNFSVDRFGFKADPRLTSIEDVIKAWRQLSMSPLQLKQVLGSMFLPETVSRILPRFTVMKPLEERDYKAVIDLQSENVLVERMYDDRGVNVGQVEVRLTPAYKKYLFKEAVIPSEGARNTVVTTQARIASDLEAALDNLPRSSKYATKPLVLTLHFLPAKTTVVAKVQLADGDGKDEPLEILRREVALNFPPVKNNGRLPEKRLRISGHEFGHAFGAVLLGRRFDHVLVQSNSPEFGGYVTFRNNDHSAEGMVAELYSLLASRTFERIMLSKNPAAGESVLAITGGASMDIKMATMNLWNMLFELGFDPNGGTIDRNAVMNGSKYADFASMPDSLVQKLGLVMRDLETFMVTDLLERHSLEWYADKIAKLAHEGEMTEAKFYEMIGYRYPGAGSSMGRLTELRELFKKHILPESTDSKAARQAKNGQQEQTIEQNIERYMAFFAKSVRKHFHSAAGSLVAPSTKTAKQRACKAAL